FCPPPVELVVLSCLFGANQKHEPLMIAARVSIQANFLSRLIVLSSKMMDPSQFLIQAFSI
ncbi:hypothetical protein, partial [Emergencia timonensis]|uniref:hypothetical protein n=1 Tax=Emergencia timonensis TaxID=1776384 RepID=UPI003990F968